MEVSQYLKVKIKKLLPIRKLSSLELTSLENLKIILFWNIVETNDVFKLDENYKIGKKYSQEQVTELSEHWSRIYDEFYEHRKNKSGKYLITKNFELIKMSLILDLLSDMENRLILLMNMGRSNELKSFIVTRTLEVISDFKKVFPKVRINQFDNIFEILTVVQAVIKSQTNIFQEKQGAKTNAVEKQKETVYDVVATMSKILGYNLDINNMKCLEFIGHENLINSMGKETPKK